MLQTLYEQISTQAKLVTDEHVMLPVDQYQTDLQLPRDLGYAW